MERLLGSQSDADRSWLATDYVRTVQRSLSPPDKRNYARPTPKACPVVFDRPGSALSKRQQTHAASAIGDAPTTFRSQSAFSIPRTSILSRSVVCDGTPIHASPAAAAAAAAAAGASSSSVSASSSSLLRPPSRLSNASSPLYHNSAVKRAMRDQCVHRVDQLAALDATLVAPVHTGSPPVYFAHGNAREAIAQLRAATPLGYGLLSVPQYHPVYGEAYHDGFDVPPAQMKDNGYFHYTGDFRRSERHGKGAITMGDGASVVGPFVHGEITGPGGVKTYPDGSTYMGALRHGEPHGQGTYHSVSDGEHYTGLFLFGQRAGDGVLQRVFQDEVYRGAFQGNRYHGQGSLEVRNKLTVEGAFEAGLPHGWCSTHYAHNSHAYEGPYVHGVESGGDCCFVDADCGLVYTGPMKDGKRAHIPNTLLLTGLTIASASLEGFFAGGLGADPPASKCEKDREACCHADPYINVYHGQTIELEVFLGYSHDVALRNILDAERQAQLQLSGVREEEAPPPDKDSKGGPKKAELRRSVIAIRGPSVHLLNSALAAPPGEVQMYESGRPVFVRLCLATAPTAAAPATAGGPSVALKKKSTMPSTSLARKSALPPSNSGSTTPRVDGATVWGGVSMVNVMSLALSTTNLNFDAAYASFRDVGPRGGLDHTMTMSTAQTHGDASWRSGGQSHPAGAATPTALTGKGSMALHTSFSFEGVPVTRSSTSFALGSPRAGSPVAHGTTTATRFAHSAIKSFYIHPMLKTVGAEQPFYDEGMTRATIDLKLGEYYAPKHGRGPGGQAGSSQGVPASAAKSRFRAAAGRIGSLLLPSGARDSAENSRQPTARLEPGTTRLIAKSAVNGKVTFSVTVSPTLPVGEYKIVVTASAECCESPGTNKVLECPTLVPVVVPIRVTLMNFQDQKPFVKLFVQSKRAARFGAGGGGDGGEDDPDDDDDLFGDQVPAVLDETQPLMDFNVSIPVE